MAMKQSKKFILAMALLGCCAPAAADILLVPIGQQGQSAQFAVPLLGESRQSVLDTHGEPDKRHPAVGQPPISRWDYPGFSVYFEHQTVIGSVRLHRPAMEKE